MSERNIDTSPRAAAERLKRLAKGVELSQDICGIEIEPCSTESDRRLAHTKAGREVKRLMINDERAVIADYQSLLRQNDNLAMLVRRLCRRVWLKDRQDEVASKAMDYLKREGLEGSIIRAMPLGPDAG